MSDFLAAIITFMLLLFMYDMSKKECEMDTVKQIAKYIWEFKCEKGDKK